MDPHHGDTDDTALDVSAVEPIDGFHLTNEHSAIIWAASIGSLEMIKRLCEAGVDIDTVDKDLRCTNSFQATASMINELHISRTPLHWAVKGQQKEAVDILLQFGASVIVSDRWGRLAIDYATEGSIIYKKVSHVMQKCLPERVPQNNGEAISAVLPLEDVEMLFEAVRAGDTYRVKERWLNGIHLNVRDSAGRTSLHLAVEHGQVEVVELLLSAGADIDAIDSDSRSPLNIACEKKLGPIVEILRQFHGRFTDRSKCAEKKAFDPHPQLMNAYQAARSGELNRLRLLVPSHVNPSAQDYDLRSLLHIASAEGQMEIVRYLVDCGSNVNVLDRWGNSPLSEAINFAHNDVARFLIQHHATEIGQSSLLAVEEIDLHILHSAFEFVLRVAAQDNWMMGLVFCPVRLEVNSCVLVAQNVWYRNCENPIDLETKFQVKTLSASENRYPVEMESTLQDRGCLNHIQLFRKAAANLMIDPGQGHVGRVFSFRQPEHLQLDGIAQSDFFLLPQARRAGIKMVLSAPMIYKMSTVAVLSWYSKECDRENAGTEMYRVQRLIRSVTALLFLKQDLINSTQGVQVSCIRVQPHGLNAISHTIFRSQYCQTLLEAITANNELLDRKFDTQMHKDILLLALEWELFELVHLLATSMSSEDHTAVLPLLRGMVSLVEIGIFDPFEKEKACRDAIHESLLRDTAQSEWDLFFRLMYVLEYLQAVSPTAGTILLDINGLLSRTHKFMRSINLQWKKILLDPAKLQQGLSDEDVFAHQQGCILCQYNVPGHIHREQDGKPTKRIALSERPRTDSGHIVSHQQAFLHLVRSPIFRTITSFFEHLQEKYDAFEKNEVVLDGTLADRVRPPTFTSSQVYDTIGASHEARRAGAEGLTPSRHEVVCMLNEMLQGDDEHDITFDQLCALHRVVVNESSGGMIRDHAAVGYASSRIYRVFMPATELREAIALVFHTLESERGRANNKSEADPLLWAYYVYAALVFYIHPFIDGNGRVARLLGNLIVLKYGFPALFRASDKTLQVEEYLHRAAILMDSEHHSKRHNRRSRAQIGRKEYLSM